MFLPLASARVLLALLGATSALVVQRGQQQKQQQIARETFDDLRSLPDMLKEHFEASDATPTHQSIQKALFDHVEENIYTDDDIVLKSKISSGEVLSAPEMHTGEAVPKAQKSADRGVAVVIHSYDGTNARKFWPMVLEGTARNIVADAPPGFKLYFAHNGEDDISCLTKDLPVKVTELKYGAKEKTLPKEEDPVIPFVSDMDYGWADSLIKTLEQVEERWLIFVQEDTAFPAHVDPAFLERIVDFAVMRDSLFMQLSRTQPLQYFKGHAGCYLEGWPQEDLGNTTFYRLAGTSFHHCKFTVNHNLALIDTKWWLDRAKRSRDRIDGGHFANELVEEYSHDKGFTTDKELEDLDQKIYAVSYNSPFASSRSCDRRKAHNLNEWGCLPDRVPAEPTTIGFDMAAPIGHHGGTAKDHWGRNYTLMGRNTLQRLGLPINENSMSGLGDGAPFCTAKEE